MNGNGVDRAAASIRARLQKLRAAASGLGAESSAEDHVGALATRIDTLAQSTAERFEALTKGTTERLDSLAHRTMDLAATVNSTSRPMPTIRGGQHDLNVTFIDEFIVGVPAEELSLALYHGFCGFHEPGVRQVFTSLVTFGSTVIDVGAAVGMYTLYAARHSGSAGRVYAFEPTPRAFTALQENLRFNGFAETGNVDARCAAAGERSGKTPFFLYPGDFSLNGRFARPAPGQETIVDMVSLDDVIPAEGAVDVVKIDTEGSEPQVLAGMAHIIRRHPRISIILQFTPTKLRRAGTDPEEFARMLLARFDVQSIGNTEGTLRPTTADELVRTFSRNLLMRPLRK